MQEKNVSSIKEKITTIARKRVTPSKESEPEPLPIFSCIYCASEHLMFSKLGTRMLNQQIDTRSTSSLQGINTQSKRIANDLYNKSTKRKLKEVLQSEPYSLFIPNVLDSKLQLITNKIYIAKKGRISKGGTFFDKSVSSNTNHKSAIPKSFLQAVAKKLEVDDISAINDKVNSKEESNNSFDNTIHNIYSPVLESSDESFIKKALKESNKIKIKINPVKQLENYLNISHKNHLTGIPKHKEDPHLTDRALSFNTLAPIFGMSCHSERGITPTPILMSKIQAAKNSGKFTPYKLKTTLQKNIAVLPKFKTRIIKDTQRNVTSKSLAKGMATMRIRLKKPPQKILVHYKTFYPNQKVITKSCGNSVTSSCSILIKSVKQAQSTKIISLRHIQRPLLPPYKNSSSALENNSRINQMMAHKYIQRYKAQENFKLSPKNIYWDSTVF